MQLHSFDSIKMALTNMYNACAQKHIGNVESLEVSLNSSSYVAESML